MCVFVEALGWLRYNGVRERDVHACMAGAGHAKSSRVGMQGTAGAVPLLLLMMLVGVRQRLAACCTTSCDACSTLPVPPCTAGAWGLCSCWQSP